jgi:hypothetical protein
MYNGFVDREMGCTHHIDYFSLCLMDDDQVVRKSTNTYLDVVIGTDLSEGYKVILSSHLSMSTYLSVLHYQSFLGTSQFTPSAIFYLSHFTPSPILHSQPLYIVSNFIHSVILHCKQFYNLSNSTTKLFYPLDHFYTFMSSHYFFTDLYVATRR